MFAAQSILTLYLTLLLLPASLGSFNENEIHPPVTHVYDRCSVILVNTNAPKHSMFFIVRDTR